MATIGTLYEDRKSGKSGVLVEIDDKHKTMMFEQSDGKTFQISTSTFKSGWRKKIDEADQKQLDAINAEEADDGTIEFNPDCKILKEESEVPVTNCVVDVNPEIISIAEKLVEKTEKKNRESDKTMYTNLVLQFVDFTKRLNIETNTENFSVLCMTTKNGIAVKWNRHRVFEVYAKFRTQNYRVFMKKQLFSELNHSLGEDKIEAMQNEEFIMDTFFNADVALLNKVREALYPIILDVVKEDK